jgi:hypothetical protein
MRTMRHTCITLNHDAGVPRELIPAIIGHEIDTTDEILKLRGNDCGSGGGVEHSAGLRASDSRATSTPHTF